MKLGLISILELLLSLKLKILSEVARIRVRQMKILKLLEMTMRLKVLLKIIINVIRFVPAMPIYLYQ